MTDPRRTTGKNGEDAAVALLGAAGLEIVERNARTRYGELDVVAIGHDTLVFVEVKALRGHGEEVAYRALESINAPKQAQVRKLARAWLAERRRPGRFSTIRFDAIGVAIPRDGYEPTLVHIVAAF